MSKLNCIYSSDYFCLMAVWLNTRLTNREPQQDDAEQFRKLVEPNYKNLNWYSFRENDISSCEFSSNDLKFLSGL